MKKLMLFTAAIMALSLSAFAGTPETKGEAKPEVKIENSSLLYHYTGKDAQGRIQFQEGPASDCNNEGAVPCEWESDSPMTSPQTEAFINSNATVLQTRN